MLGLNQIYLNWQVYGFKVKFISLPILNNVTPQKHSTEAPVVDTYILFLIILHFLKRKCIDYNGLNKR